MVDFAQITPLLDLDLESINRLVIQINQANTDMAIAIAQSQGRDGLSAKLSGNLDMNGYKLMNVGRSGDDANAPNRGELRDRSLYALPGESHKTSRMIEADGGVTVPIANQGNLAPPLSQIIGAISASLENLDATAAPPKVDDASDIGTDNGRFSREQHTHEGVNLDDPQTITGAKTFTSTIVVPDIDTGNGAVELAAGTYTPTLTNVANVTSSTAFACQYLRVGNVVHVSGYLNVTSTVLLTTTQVDISLPIASAITQQYQGIGVGATVNIAGEQASLYADITNDRMTMSWVVTTAAARTVCFVFTYQIL